MRTRHQHYILRAGAAYPTLTKVAKKHGMKTFTMTIFVCINTIENFTSKDVQAMGYNLQVYKNHLTILKKLELVESFYLGGKNFATITPSLKGKALFKKMLKDFNDIYHKHYVKISNYGKTGFNCPKHPTGKIFNLSGSKVSRRIKPDSGTELDG